MELLSIAFALGALGRRAARFGHDRRARLRSREERAAAWGLAWGGRDVATARTAATEA
jgi:hypothetical protein